MTKHFFIAGAQRSGTTYLYTVLDEHPEIEMNSPVRPEPKFFLKENSHLLIDQYMRTYFHEEGVKLRGDKSASYMETPGAAERIAHCFPEAKILFILRDPVDRATSHYWYTVSNNLENLPIEEAILNEEAQDRPYNRSAISVSPYAYLRRGRYIDYIDLYASRFPKEQIRVLAFESFIGECGAVQDLYDFLGVSRDFVPPSLDQKVNESVNGEVETSPEILRFLRAYFREPNRQLAEQFGVDISKWQSTREQLSPIA